MRWTGVGIGVAVVFAVGIGLFQMQTAQAQRVGLLPYDDAEAIVLGRAVYAGTCASCHGDNLQGEQLDWRSRGPDGRLPAPPHDANGHTWHHADDLLFAITKYGSAAVIGGGYESNMMGFEEMLTDEEILAVLGYIKSTWPREVVAQHNEINLRAGLSP